MKKLLLSIWMLLSTFALWAAQRSAEEANMVAHSFFARYPVTRSADGVRLVATSGDLLKSTSTRGVSDAPAFYIYNAGQAAYVIVSGDDRMKDILAYSDEGAFVTENLPPNLLGWLQSYSDLYSEISDTERKVLDPYSFTRAAFPEAVEPLLKNINWDQGAPYNGSCPMISGQQSVTGCVATAMAMIMKYHGYPAKGKGSHSYTSEGAEYSFNFGNTTFNWEQMLPEYISGEYTNLQASAVAQLMYACGVSVDMQYSPRGSGAQSIKVPQALIDYFGYNENMEYVYRPYFTSMEWMNMIKTELSERRPILYNGASTEVGHEFVFDGYNADDMVHVNWGWSGSNNGYFEVASLNPSSPGIGGGTNLGEGYIFQQGMVLGFQPSSTSAGYTSRFMVTELATDKADKEGVAKLAKGERFKLAITGLYNMTTFFKAGQLALVVEGNSGQTTLFSEDFKKIYPAFQGFETFVGLSSLSFSDLIVPASLSDGSYAVYLATKDERETVWSRVRGAAGYVAQFTLTVDGNDCVLAPFTGELNMEGKAELLHNLYGGRKADFRVWFSNRSTENEFYGNAGVILMTKDAELKGVSFIYTQALLASGDRDQEYLISGDLLTNLQTTQEKVFEGEYYLCPAVQWGRYLYPVADEVMEVTVKNAFGSPNLTVSNPRLVKTQLGEGESLTIMADMSITGLGNLYDETLLAAIFKHGENITYNLHYADVFIEKDEPYSFVMDIDPSVGEGQYTVNLYKPDANTGKYDGNNPLFSLPFVVGPATGIKDATADREGIVIYGQPVSDVLHVRTAVEVNRISIYNLSGQMLLQESLRNSGNECSIPVERLSAGYYIVVAQAEDGKMYRSRFIKK